MLEKASRMSRGDIAEMKTKFNAEVGDSPENLEGELTALLNFDTISKIGRGGS